MSAPALLLLTPAAGPLDDFLAALEPLRDEPGVAALLRRPGASDRVILEEAARLRRVGLPLLIHRRPDLARLARAQGVHLPERGLPIGEVRAHLGPAAIIGVSRHDGAGLAASAGATYATLSPLFTVPGKNAPLGPEGFRTARTAAPAGMAVLALGGIDPSTAPVALDAGADGLAVLRGVSRARTLLDILRERKG